ncbi:HNH endonuclease [Spirosoma taeanense]|uniref:HNH endonuclease n=1 Tax=Spirosoma taeanense TaxID=2735870 RepID=A0A6M5Y841_9BACT|nr:HNH endonuclease signature motif containing protein [Spirosoma taeanense]QJW90498.1 HNH endonuclease [Spirosoma taeanense]
MAITDKTRKTLWARSGNRCAICRKELVAERNEHDRNLNIGDECHIISEKPNGPRYTSDHAKDHDDYGNLILLCKNHHKTIDELWETYTVDLLKTFKNNHENWIRTVIDNADNKAKANAPRFLKRLTTGKQIVDIIREVHAYQFDHDEFKSQEEAEFVSSFLQNLHDWGEASSFGDFEIGRQVQLGYELNKEIEEIEQKGFFIFGERKSSKMTNGNKDDLGVWDISTIIILRQDNPAIINAEKIIAQNQNRFN